MTASPVVRRPPARRPQPVPRRSRPQPGGRAADPPHPRRAAPARKGAPRRHPGRSRRATGAAVAIAVGGATAAGWGTPSWALLLGLPPLLALGELLVAALAPGRAGPGGAVTEALVAAGLLLAPGAWLVVAVLGGLALEALGLRVLRAGWGRRLGLGRPRRATARLAASAGAAAVVAAGGGRLGAVPALAATAGMAAWWAVGHALVVMSVARTTGRHVRRLLAHRAPATFTPAAAAASVGITGGWLTVHAPVGLLGLLVPLGLLAQQLRRADRGRTEATLFAELARGHWRGADSVDEGAQLLVTSAARLLGGADVEVVVLGAEGPVRYRGDEQGTAVRSRVDPDAFDEPWLLQALASGGHGVRTGTEAGRPVLTVLVGPGAGAGATPGGGAEAVVGLLAALVARRPVGGAPFGRSESALAEVLAVQATGWLRGGAAARSGAEAPTASGDSAQAPAGLRVLREAAARLVRVAAWPPGAPAGGTAAVGSTATTPLSVGSAAVDLVAVVEELQVIERSVASLLGSAALPAEGRDPADPALEVTSTGTLA